MPATFIKATFTKFEFKRLAFSKAFDTAMKLLMRNAAREFAREALLHVPVQTGFARGALLNLTDAIGLSAASSPQSFLRKLDKRRGKIVNVPLNGKLSYYTDSGGKVPKTPENARQFSTKPENVFSDSNFVYTFNYKQSIFYYYINDKGTNPYTPSAPWLSFPTAHAVFVKYINDNILQAVPAISDYILKTRVTNG